MKISASLCLVTFVGLALPSSAALLAHYSFDTDFTDGSGNANHATQVDGATGGNSGITTTVGDSVFGGGAYFNAEQGDYVDIPDQVFANGDSWTVSMWGRRVNNDDHGMLIGDRGDIQNFIWHTSNFSGLRIRNAADATQDITAPKDTEWNHWAIVANGTSGQTTVYLNNAVIAGPFNYSTAFEFREIADAYSTLQLAFVGQIDEVHIFDEAIDAAKVAELFNGAPDTAAPVLLTITDDRIGGPVAPDSLVTYTVNFSGDMDAATVTADDFGNAGTAGFAIGTVTESAPGVFLVPVTPDSTGTLRLQVKAGAVLADPAGNALDTVAVLLDDTTLVVEADSTPPTLAGGDMVDDQGGGPVTVQTPVTYTITFSEDMDDATVGADDFGNAGTATVSIGAINEVSPGVFTVEVTPTTAGTLQLAVLAGASLADGAGNPLGTTSAIVSTIEITVQEGFSAAWVKRLRVVFVAGQSNADGRAATSELPTSPVNLQLPQDDVDFFYRVEGTIYLLTTLRPGRSETGGFGPAITCGRYLADELADGLTTRLAVIKYANGCTNLYSQWAAGGDNTTSGDGSQYVRFQETVTAGLAALSTTYPNAAIELLGLVWLQGESDAGSQAASYEANLTNFIADVRATYGSGLRFIVIRLSDGQTAINATGLATIRAAQTAVAAADPLTGLVDSDGFGMKTDNLHFNGLGQQQNGEASAIQLLNLYPFLSPLQVGPGSAGDVDVTVHDAFDGFVYALESSATMASGSWVPEGTVTAAGDRVEFTLPPAGPQRFYRVGRSLAP